ncbi:MAG: dihydrofolate reductase [Nitrospiraceae bacterium]|nr:dihydrofolate reductase [Nitrospiraceae bacterium]
MSMVLSPKPELLRKLHAQKTGGKKKDGKDGKESKEAEPVAVEEEIENAKNFKREIFIIGGAEIYQQLMPHIQRIYLTIVHDVFKGDTYFPELNPVEKLWQYIYFIYNKRLVKLKFKIIFLIVRRQALRSFKVCAADNTGK